MLVRADCYNLLLSSLILPSLAVVMCSFYLSACPQVNYKVFPANFDEIVLDGWGV